MVPQRQMLAILAEFYFRRKVVHLNDLRSPLRNWHEICIASCAEMAGIICDGPHQEKTYHPTRSDIHELQFRHSSTV